MYLKDNYWITIINKLYESTVQTSYGASEVIYFYEAEYLIVVFAVVCTGKNIVNAGKEY